MKNIFQDEYTFLSEYKSRIENKYIKTLEEASTRERYNVLGELVFERIASDWMKTKELLSNQNQKEVYYFSMEFLMGRLITNNIMNLGLRDVIEKGLNLAHEMNLI